MQSQENDAPKLIPTNAVLVETRFACIEGWFVRARWENKVNFISALVQILKESAVNRLISEIVITLCKDSVYSENSKTDSFDYIPQDDDRELEHATLHYFMKEDMIWFGGLNAEDQLNVLTGLIRIGGVPIARKALDSMQKKLSNSERTKKLVQDILLNSPLVVETQQGGILKNLQEKKSYSPDVERESKKSKPDKSDVSWKIVSSPAVQAAMQLWISEMTSMHSELKSWDPHDKFKASNINQTVDILQTLPLWSTKYFAQMLTPNTQANLKKVNPYWQNIINDIKKEKMIHALVDKTIGKALAKPKVSKYTMKSIKSKKSKLVADEPPEKPVEVIDDKVKPKTSTIMKLLDEKNLKYGHPNTAQYCVIDCCHHFNTSQVVACNSTSGILALTTQKATIALHAILTGAELIPPLAGHAGIITCLTFHPEGDSIFSGGTDLTVRWWDIWRQTEKKTYLGHEQSIASISVTADLVASASLDQHVHVYQMKSGLQLFTLEDKHPFSQIHIESKPKQKLFCTNDQGEIIVYNNETQGRKITKAHNGKIMTIFMSLHLFLTGSYDGYVKVWNKHRIEKCLLSLNHKRPVLSVILSCHQVISGCESGHVMIWCVCKGTLLRSFSVTPDLRPVLQVLSAQHEDMPANLVVGTDSTVKILDFYQGDEEYRHIYHTTCCNNPNKIADFYFPSCRWASKKAITEALIDPEIFKNGFTMQESFYHKRIRNTIRRGCTDRKLRSSQPCNWQKAVYLQALQEIQQFIPTCTITPFPRSNYDPALQ